ncbi:MAG TPA: J domain-containing protein [Candidatus Ozemobacteraceae bacterium]|nr:J domain-containing protein [Candidatus Ozemobacteraceae bacterium]
MSSTFTALLGSLRRETLCAFLRSLTQPCYESSLLHAAFPDFDIIRASPVELYRHHFALFHVLYDLQDQFRDEGSHLHVHFMRTSLVPFPPDGCCRHFEGSLGRFCGVPVTASATICDTHAGLFGEKQLDALSDRYFYADARNFEALAEEQAEAFLQGTWEVLGSHDRLRKAFDTLGLAPTCERKVIRNRFAALARECHPDAGAGSAARFCEINAAYRLVLRLLDAFEPHQTSLSDTSGSDVPPEP